MSHAVRILRRAEDDLLEIQRYVEVESPGRSGPVIDALLEVMASLAEMPLRGAMPSDAGLRRAGYRFLVQAPHVVFYKVRARTVVVMRVLHARRAWTSMLR